MEEITLKFLYYQNLIKIYHWQTKSYARHKASDELYQILVDKVDEFLEVIQGSRNRRVRFSNVKPLPIRNVSDNGSIKMLNGFNNWLKNMELNKEDIDLMNIRDEIVSAVNKTLYLFSLN